MNINSERLRELTEEKIGKGKSEYLFGRSHRWLFQVISEEEWTLTETEVKEGLERCEFKDPEMVGLISLFCPILCTEISDRIYSGKFMREFYKLSLMLWYTVSLVNIVSCLVEWETNPVLPIIVISFVSTSWLFRNWSKKWNTIELYYRIMQQKE